MCLDRPIQGQSHWEESQGRIRLASLGLLSLSWNSVVEQGTSFFNFAPGSAAGW